MFILYCLNYHQLSADFIPVNFWEGEDWELLKGEYWRRRRSPTKS